MQRKESRLRRWVLAVSTALIIVLFVLVIYTASLRAEKVSLTLDTVSSLHENDRLRVGSRWVGVLEISEHEGEGLLADGMRLIRGYIGQDEKGCFFELFNLDDPDTALPLLTMGVRLEGDTMVPEIGEEDAAYFYIWLDGRDVERCTLRLENGTLSQRFFYNDGYETCWIEFHIKEEKNT